MENINRMDIADELHEECGVLGVPSIMDCLLCSTEGRRAVVLL